MKKKPAKFKRDPLCGGAAAVTDGADADVGVGAVAVVRVGPHGRRVDPVDGRVAVSEDGETPSPTAPRRRPGRRRGWATAAAAQVGVEREGGVLGQL